MTYTEAYHMPIWKRKWYLDRVIKEINNANGKSKGESAANRAMGGNNMRPTGPQRTKRFT